MTLDDPGAGELPAEELPGDLPPAAGAPAAQSSSEQALQRYGRRMRRSRTIYFGIVAAVTLVLATLVGVVWSRGEIAHTSLKTAAHPAPSVALQIPAPTQQRAWQSADRTAIGTPYWGGTVITYTAHSVRGRDAGTGAITWSYTRTDRTVCQAIQDQGNTVAVFEVNGNCDQLTGLDSGTGRRRWDRTLDKAEGQVSRPLDGHPTYSLTPDVIMLTSPGVIYAIDPVSGLDRWLYHPDGCTIAGAVIGTEGALISQSCARPTCSGLKFCGAGPQLLLRDGSAGRNEDDKANPDRIKWNLLATNAIPASADKPISAVVPGRLLVLDAAKGRTISQLPLTGDPGSTAGIAAVQTDHGQLLWIAGTTYSVERLGTRVIWSSRTAAPPTVTPSPGTSGDLAASIVAVADSAGIVVLDPDTGRVSRMVAVAAPPPGSLVYPFGSGFVVAGPSTTVYR